MQSFSYYQLKKSFQMFPRHNKATLNSESFALNLCISTRLTNI